MRTVDQSPGLLIELSQAELEARFGPLAGACAWHRLEERASKLNRSGADVRLLPCRARLAVRVGGPGEQELRAFAAKLAEAPGPVQRAWASI